MVYKIKVKKKKKGEEEEEETSNQTKREESDLVSCAFLSSPLSYTLPPPVSGNDPTTTLTASNEAVTDVVTFSYSKLKKKKKENPENWYEVN